SHFADFRPLILQEEVQNIGRRAGMTRDFLPDEEEGIAGQGSQGIRGSAGMTSGQTTSPFPAPSKACQNLGRKCEVADTEPGQVRSAARPTKDVEGFTRQMRIV